MKERRHAYEKLKKKNPSEIINSLKQNKTKGREKRRRYIQRVMNYQRQLRAAITKYLRLSGLNNRNLFSSQFYRLEVQHPDVSKVDFF